MKAIRGKRCRHRKGGEYLIVDLAEHTETGEELVIYRREVDGKLYARPRVMFEDGRFEEVEGTLVERLKGVEHRIREAEEGIKGLVRERNEILEASLVAEPGDKVMVDVTASLLIQDPSEDLFGRPKPSRVDGLGWAVQRLLWADGDSFRYRREGPAWVKVRPCDPELKNRTYLGFLIGDFPLTVGCRFDRDTQTLRVEPMRHNPMMYIPDLQRVVFGCESWWGVLETPEDLRSIEDADIDDVWYVRALKSLTKGAGA